MSEFNPQDILSERGLTNKERQFFEDEYKGYRKTGPLFLVLWIFFWSALLGILFLLISEWKYVGSFTNFYEFMVKITSIPSGNILWGLMCFVLFYGMLFIIPLYLMNTQEITRIKKDLEEGKVYRMPYSAYKKNCHLLLL